MKVVVLIFLLVQYCRSETVWDLAEKLSKLENEMTTKITEILQDGNRLFDTRINSLEYVVRSQRFGTADVHNRTTHKTRAALSRMYNINILFRFVF